VRLRDEPGELARLTSFLSHRNLNIHSLLTSPEGRENVRVVMRIASIETRLLAGEMRSTGFDVVWPPEKPWPP
jgi:acetoin utilization protein AcuB